MSTSNRPNWYYDEHPPACTCVECYSKISSSLDNESTSTRKDGIYIEKVLNNFPQQTRISKNVTKNQIHLKISTENQIEQSINFFLLITVIIFITSILYTILRN